MAYCTVLDIQNSIGMEQLAELSNDTAGASLPDTIVVAALIEQADRIIDGKAGQVYTVPFSSPVPDQIIQISRNYAIFFLFGRRFTTLGIPDSWKEIKKQMDQLLDDISNMLVDLPNATLKSQEANVVPKEDYPAADFTNESGDSSVSLF